MAKTNRPFHVLMVKTMSFTSRQEFKRWLSYNEKKGHKVFVLGAGVTEDWCAEHSNKALFAHKAALTQRALGAELG